MKPGTLQVYYNKPLLLGDWSITRMPNGITVLSYKNNVVMLDSASECNDNDPVERLAHGDVLMAGLGLGMSLLSIQDKPEVDSVTVLEYSRDIIQIAATHIPIRNKVSVCCTDAREWEPAEGQKFDFIYLDIWWGYSGLVLTDLLADYRHMEKKYLSYLKPGKEKNIILWAYDKVLGDAYNFNVL